LNSPVYYKFITIKTDFPLWAAWSAPFLYTAFNLSLAQAVLVPIGAQVKDVKTIKRGAILGGFGIGFMLLVGHFALSTHMPGIQQLAIPMGGIAAKLGITVYLIYTIII